ncbi:E3 ubiquitin-protein ligase Mdm2-like [Mytilus edulis]|uniref:E3 ubiquitin-protein ligase Mdm2-like n=2 Tax=Mytilus edulis TaxID=6550 RepID=UPI0039EEDE20
MKSIILWSDPDVNFLTVIVLKQVGASWEVLTRKEVCSYLKDYIGSRQLYNQNDPSIVFCKKDPLGKVFGVDKFTFTEATY